MTHHPPAVVVSASWATPASVCDAFAAAAPTRVVRRSSDWEAGRLRKAVSIVRSTLAVVTTSRREPLVLLTVGAEVYVAALACRLLPGLHRRRLVVADFLTPRSRRLPRLQGWLLRRVDGWVCIRRGDVDHLERAFGVDRARCHFVPFPVSMSALERSDARAAAPVAQVLLPGSGQPIQPPFVYSAGSAHRNWRMVVDAAGLLAVRVVISTDRAHPDLQGDLPDNLVLLDPVTPEVGRRLATAADVVVVALDDTHLPSGPLVLVDAMALAKAIVVTDVNGTRDYVHHEVSGLVVPPGDAEALAQGVERLLSDAPLRAQLAARAADFVDQSLQPSAFATGVLVLVDRDRDGWGASSRE